MIIIDDMFFIIITIIINIVVVVVIIITGCIFTVPQRGYSKKGCTFLVTFKCTHIKG